MALAEVDAVDVVGRDGAHPGTPPPDLLASGDNRVTTTTATYAALGGPVTKIKTLGMHGEISSAEYQLSNVNPR